MEFLKSHIRDIPDFPEAGIIFRDITPLLAAPDAFRQTVSALAEKAPPAMTHIAAVEARGFIFGAAVASLLGVSFVPIRKPGKLPHKTVAVDYALEYGKDRLTMHEDALGGDAARVYLVDDLIATGGTLAAARQLIQRCGGELAGVGCVIELSALDGRQLLDGTPFFSLIQY